MPMPAPTPVFVPVPQPKKSGCSTATIIVLVVLLIVVCGGALLATGAWYTQKHNADATVTAMNGDATATADNATATADTAQLTPTPYPPYTESNPPSGQDFSGTAQEIITRAQMASEMNSQDQPTELQSTFEPFQTIYLAYHWANIGYSGYVYTVWYFNGQQESTGTSDYINTDYRYYDGYISTDFSNDGQGAVEVYYCQKSDCSDRQLAWMRPFSVAG